jgi:16S rRNA (uracil1498-N3)-methyltransferase
MRIPRLYIPQPLVQGDTLILDRRAAHHIRQVLRLSGGATLRVFDGRGSEHKASLLAVSRAQVSIGIGAASQVIPEPSLSISLAQGIPRGERMDFILQKAIELGVARIQPLWMRRSQSRVKGERLERRVLHWQRVMIHACEQSGRSTLPVLEMPVDFPLWAQTGHSEELRLLLDPRAGQTLNTQRPPGKSIVLLVGPEGGISPGERSRAEQVGFTAIRMGPRVLRTETAALGALAGIQSLWGDFRQPGDQAAQ